MAGGGDWFIPAGDTNEYFLSGTFSSPSNEASCLDYQVWDGVLQLPKLKISIKKP
jgi:hypothetical protein